MSVRPSQSPSREWLKYTPTALFLLISAAAAVACPLCYEAARQLVTIGQQLDMADRVVLAVPVEGGNRFRIVEIVKGKDTIGDVIVDPVTSLEQQRQ